MLINTIGILEVMKHSLKISKLLLPLNDAIREAYEAGVKEINIEVEEEHPFYGSIPMVHVNCFDYNKNVRESKNH